VRTPEGPIVFVHSSDELYGADRVVLDIHAALPDEWRTRAEFWLPTDVRHGASPLCVELEQRGAVVRHLDLPVLRRAYATPAGVLTLLRRLRSFRRLLRGRTPEILYCTTSALFFTAPTARRAGVSRVLGHVQEIWSRGDALLLGPFTRSVDRLIAISEPVRHSLPEHLQARTRVVPNGTQEPAEVTPVVGHDGPLRFLVASRWNGWKGHRTLLAAWDLVEAPCRLVVLGGPPPSGKSVDVRAMVSSLRRPETVEVIGEVTDVASWINDADVVVVPSESPEPFGLVAVEAFARGRPVVGSRGGGLAEIIDDGVDGWLFAPGDSVALANLLNALTREDVVRAGANARSSYANRFTASRYADDWRRALAP
jgi:glycosyltransferase involved in cell wall biosynthesis